MKVIGLTGGIGSGKSTVARFLAELGARTMDLDVTGHEVLRDPAILKDLVQAFGDGILDIEGQVDRAKLAPLVFNNPEELRKLSEITHPAIDARAGAFIDEARRDGFRVVVLEAAALMEAGRVWQMDEVWVTVAPRHVIVDRVRQRSGMTEAEVLDRIRAQMPNEERAAQADVVIDTDCSRDELKQRVRAAWEALLIRL
jgi:dephospho-CoA kinase